ncbi:MAG: hypothetical protein KDA28_04815, partial [Phycisphaerales bacterium]|nr:hypothetical protein [Phycisphaerales bacterium]
AMQIGRPTAPTIPTDAPVAQAPRIERLTTVALATITTSADVGAGIERLDDEQLVSTLERIGRPSGLIRQGQRAILTSNVTDETEPTSALPRSAT